jgi:hypothetical protein
MHVPAHHGPSKPQGRFQVLGAELHYGATCPPRELSSPLAGGVYEVCPGIVPGGWLAMEYQVVRRDRLPGDLQEPVFPALGGLGRLVRGEQVFPAQAAPPVLPGQQAHDGSIQRGFRLLAAAFPVCGASGHEKIPVCGQLGPAVWSSEFLVDGH